MWRVPSTGPDCADDGATMMAAGRVAGVRVKSAPTSQSLRRMHAAQMMPQDQATWGHDSGTTSEYPWVSLEAELPDADERKRRDAWQQLFMPSGAALVATQVDTHHWLTAGAGEQLTVLFGRSPVLMAKPPAEAPLRVGVFTASESAPALANWSPVPAGQSLRVRAAGLLWPEARDTGWLGVDDSANPTERTKVNPAPWSACRRRYPQPTSAERRLWVQ